MPARHSLAAFGQELYRDEAAQALRLAIEAETRADLRERIMSVLPQRSQKTRGRIADKLIQRLVPIRRGQVVVSPFVRLAANIGDPQACTELIYYRTAQTDTIVAALAAEIFYPYFVQGRPPKGFSANQFRFANTGALFDYDNVITASFIVSYARRAWGFRSQPTVLRALRILREAGLIEALPSLPGGARQPAFAIAPHTMRLPTFALCLYEEFASRRAPALALDQMQNAHFARMLIVRPVDVTAMAEDARRHKLLVRSGGAAPRYAPATNLEGLVDKLLGARSG